MPYVFLVDNDVVLEGNGDDKILTIFGIAPDIGHGRRRTAAVAVRRNACPRAQNVIDLGIQHAVLYALIIGIADAGRNSVLVLIGVVVLVIRIVVGGSDIVGGGGYHEYLCKGHEND